MKRYLLIFICLFSIVPLGLFSQKTQKKTSEIFISGKIENYDKQIPIVIFANRLNKEDESFICNVDSNGQFSTQFESAIPLDFLVKYKSNFLMIAHPGDHIFVNFDGIHTERPEILKTVRFSGDRATTNNYIRSFQEIYFQSPTVNDDETQQKSIQQLKPKAYLRYLKGVRKSLKKIYLKFEKEYDPDVESRIWAKTFSDQFYFSKLALYPLDHRLANNMTNNDQWDVNQGFFDNLNERLPLKEDMLVSSYAIKSFIDYYQYYLMDMEKNHLDSTANVVCGVLIAPSSSVDSIVINSIVKHVKDDLLKQLLLADRFRKCLDKLDLDVFLKYENLIKNEIKLDYLIEPLLDLAADTKKNLGHSTKDNYSGDQSRLQGNNLLDSIYSKHKNKIIYLDVWATWCGPCLSEMPESNLLRSYFNKEDVVFVYVSINSERDKWNGIISKYNLDGDHYFLSPIQSAEMLKSLNINSIPYYILIDPKGQIVDKGSHLRPSSAKEAIINLLR